MCSVLLLPLTCFSSVRGDYLSLNNPLKWGPCVLKVHSRSALALFFFFFFQCSVACCWVEAQKRDKVCHLCCCCCFSHVHISRAKKLIKTHTGRTLSSKQWDVTINKLQEVGSLLPGCIMLTHFNKSKITALSSVCGKKECAHFIL